MMRVVLIFFLLISTTSLLAQDEVLFKIITYTKGVLLDGRPVTIGQDVRASASQLFIPDHGWVGLITADGNAHKLTKLMPVSQVNAFLRKPVTTGVVHDGPPFYTHTGGLAIPIAAEYRYAETLEDSVFIFWISQDDFYPDGISKAKVPAYREYTVRFSNMYDDSLAGFRVDRNWIVAKYPTSDAKKEKNKGILYQVNCWSPKAVSETHFLNRASEKTKDYVRSKLASLESSSDQEYLRCAFFDLSNFKLDMNMSLYRIITKKLSTSDPILQKYLSNQISTYHLGLMQLER